jgi:hypothetical protein
LDLAGRTGAGAAAITGLAGNLPEYVRDETGGRLLLAGGCYEFPANLCTLDAFLDPAWEVVQIAAEGDAAGDRAEFHFALRDYAGFRMVLETGSPY